MSEADIPLADMIGPPSPRAPRAPSVAEADDLDHEDTASQTPEDVDSASSDDTDISLEAGPSERRPSNNSYLTDSKSGQGDAAHEDPNLVLQRREKGFSKAVEAIRRWPTYSPETDDALAACISLSMQHQIEMDEMPGYISSFSGTCIVRANMCLGKSDWCATAFDIRDFDKAFSPLFLSDNNVEFFQILAPMEQFSRHGKAYRAMSRCLRFSPSILTSWYNPTSVMSYGFAARISSHRSSMRMPETSLSAMVGQISSESEEEYQLRFRLVHRKWLLESSSAKIKLTLPADRDIRGVTATTASIPGTRQAFDRVDSFFYLTFFPRTKRVAVLVAPNTWSIGRFRDLCQKYALTGAIEDPFTFVSAALSEVLHRWDPNLSTSRYVNEEIWIHQQGNFLRPDKVVEAQSRLIQARLMRHNQIVQSVEGERLRAVVQDAVDEHVAARSLLGIPETVFERTHRNLCTILSQSKSLEIYQKAGVQVLDSVISRLSYLLSLQHDRAIDANTEAMKTVAERNEQEAHVMRDLAEATKRDSEAMKLIALLTMIYLPATFVATFFSAGVVKLGIDDELVGFQVSPYWWLYFLVAVLLTGATFVVFNLTQKRVQKKIETLASSKPQAP